MNPSTPGKSGSELEFSAAAKKTFDKVDKKSGRVILLNSDLSDSNLRYIQRSPRLLNLMPLKGMYCDPLA